MIRVALINDHPIVVEGLRTLLQPFPQVDIVELDTFLDVRQPVDLALLDTHAQAAPLHEAVAERLAEASISRLAVFTWTVTEQAVQDALGAGAHGVLSKQLAGDELARALVRIGQGEVVVARNPQEQQAAEDLAATQAGRGRDWPGRDQGLTMRESEMIALICQGLTNEQIAARLYLSPNSVKSYIRSAYHKAGVSSRSRAVLWGIDHGLRPVASRRTA
ncbi:DNA-binding NarL/FixJ family response regulator [Luteococcus japonicus]|uniref:DNA-binding NarL/FixJ family response regulator n=2 Tax=Luteococcus japonicus TaxID=33984 RepID=A0A3N1ZTG5_9ACTN|nr:DNA-binding NarL/FixJ family response regulator [Luteococcus japonicus]SJN42809.1 putative two-component system response regulator [Luteococcus japonicus LSP_Lj1]